MKFKYDNPITDCQLKFDKDDKGSFSGYASVYNGVDTDGDTIIPGAFKNALANGRSPAMFINHNSHGIPVGGWTELGEDSTGLLVHGQIDLNHKDGISLYSALNKGNMDAMSIGFRVFAGGSEKKVDDDGNATGGQNFTDIDLKEISLVTFPADDSARVSAVKSDVIELQEIRDFDYYLRDAGNFSRSVAKALVSQFKTVVRRDVEHELIERNAELEAIIKEIESRYGVQHSTDHLVRAIDNFKI